MSPKQYYFPYFFEIKQFNTELESFGISSYVKYDEKSKSPKELILIKGRLFEIFSSPKILLRVPFGMTMMIMGNYLLFWDTDYDKIGLHKVNLTTLTSLSTVLDLEIDISKLEFGSNKINFDTEISDFVTFLRKSDLKYNLDYYEQFVILIIEKDKLKMIPFEWFNRNGGDYGYVWPATAKIDESKSKLYGQGMRMANFIFDLNKPADKPQSLKTKDYL